jgi:nucleoside phosphorylase
MSNRYKVGILVPLHEEYQYLTEIAQPTKTVRAEGDFYYQLMPPGYMEPVIAQVLEDMGPMRAAIAAERLISRFDVDIVALVGIAGALDRDLLLGDVVVASEVDQYQYGAKAETSVSGSPSIQQAGMHWRASHSVLEIVRSFSLSPETRATYDAWRNLASSRRPAIDDAQIAALVRDRPIDAVGPIASGDVVGAAAWFRDALLRRNRKLLAIEMEGAGVAATAIERSDPRNFIVVRGLSDFADERKAELDRAHQAGSLETGAMRRYALLSAVEYLLRLLPILLQSLEVPEPTSVESTVISSPVPGTASVPLEISDTKNEQIADQRVENFALMSDDEFEVNLEHELATRYHREASIRRILTRAKVRWQSISLNGPSTDVWFEALQEVKAQGKLSNLLRIVAREYPGTPSFTEALSRYGG